MSQPAARMGDFFRNRFVQAILMSGLLLQIGIWVRNYSILMYVAEKTNNDPKSIALISVAEFVPIFVFSFIGGTFADRWKPKRTMVLSDLLSAVSIFAVLLAMVLGTWKAVFFATFVSAILSQFSQPSGMKLFKLHVPEEQMQMGMSMYQTLFAVFMILGPIIGTLVFQHFGIEVSIAVTGIAFLLSAGVLLYLPADRLEKDKGEVKGFLHELTLGFRYVWSSKVLKTLGGSFIAAGLAIGLIQPLGILLVTERLGLSKEHLQWLMSVNGVAMLFGGVITMGLAKKISPPVMLAGGMGVSAVSIVVCGWSTELWLTLLFQFFSGLVMPGIQIAINTMMLNHAEHSFVGRVNGILNPLFMGSMVITMMLSGWLKETISLVSVYEVSGGLFILGVLVMVPLFGLKTEPKSPLKPEAQNS